MAIRYEPIYIDDLDGATLAPDEAETIEFALDGKAYTIDLGVKNAAAFREAMEIYVRSAQRVTPAKKRADKATRSKSGSSAQSESVKIRQWAVQNGHAVSGRGRIHAEIVEAYNAAH